MGKSENQVKFTNQKVRHKKSRAKVTMTGRIEYPGHYWNWRLNRFLWLQ
jgi:hypothetical protein